MPYVPSHTVARPLLVAVALATAGLTLVGCSSPATPAGSSKVFEFVNPAPGVPAWQAIASCFQKEAKKQGVVGKVVGSSGSDFNTSAALTLLDQAVADKVSGVALNTSAGASTFEPVIASATKSGIAVGTVESGDASAARNFDVGIDIPQYAKHVATYLKSLPGQKNVAFLTIALSGTPKIFGDTLASAIASDPTIKIVTTVPDNGDVTEDPGIVSSILTAHPEVNYILTVNPASTAGVVTAIKEANAVGKTSLIGISLDDTSRAALQSGTASAIYVQQMCAVGTLTLDNLVNVSKGKTVAKDIPVGTEFATKSNLATLGSQWN